MNVTEKKTWARIIESIEQRRNRLGDAIDKAMEGVPAGFESVPDDVFTLWFEEQVAASPPVVIQGPDGSVQVASPWILMLPMTTNGNALLRRYERLIGAR